MRRFWLGLILILTLTSPTSTALAQGDPPVLAFYYAWFDMNTWASGQTVDLPNPQYISADAATIERHITQAQSAGIEAFVQSWYGPQVENNQTETNFRILLDLAAAKGFKAAVDFETLSPFYANDAAAIDGLATLLATHVNHPAYLRYQGKPVIFFWRQQRFTPSRWADIRQQLDPNGDTIWIAEGIDLSYQSVFNGHHLYSIAWAGSVAAELAKWPPRINAFEAENGVDRLWVATVMPGYNDTRLGRADGFAVPRRDGAYYRETWQAALATQPDMIIINSFNEWPEGTHIEPSVSYGNRYLDLTRELVTDLRNGVIPAAPPPPDIAPQAETAALNQAPAAQTPPDGPYIEAPQRTNVRAAPSLTADVVTVLAAGSQTAVIGRLADSSWWQIEAGWVSNTVVDFVGDVASVPTVESEATEAETAPEPQPTPLDTPTPEPTPSPTPTETNLTVVGTLTATTGVNVRAEPSLEGARLGGLFLGETVGVLTRSEDDAWWQIEYGESSGWVSADFVEFGGLVEDVPIFGQTPPPTATPEPTPSPTVEVVLDLDALDLPDLSLTPVAIVTGSGILTPAEEATTGDTVPARLIPIDALPTYAPTATSLHQATSVAMLATQSTPEPTTEADATTAEEPAPAASDPLPPTLFDLFGGWSAWPWGILSGLLLVWFVGHRWRLMRKRQREARRQRARERVYATGQGGE